MFRDPADFAFASVLERDFAVFREEADGLRREEYVPWPERKAYLGGWLVFPLLAESYREILDVDLAPFRRRCPRSARILDALPGIAIGGFSRLEPGAHVLPHVDGSGGAVLRCHLGLRVPPGPRIRIGAEVRGWLEGKCLVFDVDVQHEAANPGKEPRIVLLVDFRLPLGPPALSCGGAR